MANSTDYRNYKVDYNALKRAIRASLIQQEGINFIVDYQKLKGLVSNMEIQPLPIFGKSRKILPNDVPYIGEFFKGESLLWINQYKEYNAITFIIDEYLDDRARDLIEKLKTPQVDDPDIDKVKCYAELCANYPCYTAVVVSYESNDIKRHGLLGSEIMCRANTVCIKLDNYKYRHEDMD